MTGSDTLQASTGECLFGIAAAKVTTEETFFTEPSFQWLEKSCEIKTLRSRAGSTDVL